MRVQDVMCHDVEACRLDTDLAAAGMIMWRRDCGIVPVLAESGERVVGVITDRDICMAASTRHLRCGEIAVGDVISRRVFAVRPRDDVQQALALMRAEKVRRLPVLNQAGDLVGMVSLNDVVRHVQPGRRAGALTAEDIVETLQAIGKHRTVEAKPAEGARAAAPSEATADEARSPMDEVAIAHPN
jgi:CBS domain-containing protein